MPTNRRSVQQLLALLVASLIIDFIGILSYLLPILGELFDIPWAPISGLLVKNLYPDLPPAVPWFAFIEEASRDLKGIGSSIFLTNIAKT